jgi:hypothetical protein
VSKPNNSLLTHFSLNWIQDKEKDLVNGQLLHTKAKLQK